MNESKSVSSSERDGSFGHKNINIFTEDHRALIGRVQCLRKELADWRDRAAARTEDYTDQLKELQNDLLQSMENLKEDVVIMSSKVRVALDKHDPAWREKQAERR